MDKHDKAIAELKHEWKNCIRLLEKKLAMQQANELVSPGLKVKHKESGFLYTVDSVSKNDVVLRTPEGHPFLIDKGTFEEDYELS